MRINKTANYNGGIWAVKTTFCAITSPWASVKSSKVILYYLRRR